MSENQSPTTPSYSDFVKKLFNKSGDPSKDFCHAVLGVVTEIHEYLSATDEVNGIEELGDLCFYLVAMAQVVEEVTGQKQDPSPLVHEISETAFASAFIAHSCNALLDDAKRWIGYGKAPANLPEVLRHCAELVYFVNVTGPYPCEDVGRLTKTNMAKLLKRYPGGEFSAFRALVRDLDGERAVLQTA